MNHLVQTIHIALDDYLIVSKAQKTLLSLSVVGELGSSRQVQDLLLPCPLILVLLSKGFHPSLPDPVSCQTMS